MPSEQGYESRVMPQAAPAPVQVSPDAYGAGFGRALQGAGQVVQQAQNDRQIVDASLKLTQARAAMTQDILHLRTDGARPGGAGHMDDVQAAWEAHTQAIADGIKDPHIARQVQLQIAEQGTSFVDQAATWQAGQQVAHTLQQVAQTSAISDNLVYNDPTQLAHEMAARHAAIDALGGLTPDHKEELKNQSDIGLSTASLRGGDPAAGIAMLHQGAFNFLPPHVRQTVEDELGIKYRQQLALGKQADAAQVAAAHEVLQTARAQIENGEPIDQAAVVAARDRLVAHGDTSKGEEANGLLAQDGFARQYQGALPVQMVNRLAELAAKPKPTTSEQLEQTFLKKAIGPRQDAFRADSKEYFVRFGSPDTVPPPLDLSTPQAANATVQWTRKMTAVSGQQVNLLLKDQATALAEAAKTGVAGRVDVLAQLDTLPDHERDIAAKQIMPTDASFWHEAQIAPEVRAIVYNGQEALKANPQLLKPNTKTQDGIDKQNLLAIMGQELRTSLYTLAPDDSHAIQQLAGQWLAGQLAGHNRTADSLTPWDIRQAATFALGGHFKNGRQYGGIEHWHDDHPFVMPENMWVVDFINNVQRDQTIKARDGHGPSQDLRTAYPIYLNAVPGGARYRWQTAAGRIVVDAKGRDYISDVVAGQ